MKAEQIAEFQRIIDSSLKRRSSSPMSNGIESEALGICFWLAEIALQLAKQNEVMNSIENCIVGESNFRVFDISRRG